MVQNTSQKQINADTENLLCKNKFKKPYDNKVKNRLFFSV